VVAWLEKEYGTRDPILTDSGTSALALAFRSSHAASGRPIALPAYGCYDLVTAALGAHVPVTWYDLDPMSLAPDWRSLEAALAAGAAAIVIVHFYGIPVDMRPVREMAQRFGALVIEDAAQGIGGSIEERPLGAFGDLAVLSFGRGKGLTGGGGGALLVNTEAGRAILGDAEGVLAPAGKGLKLLITTMAQWLLARPSVYALPAALPFLRLGETVFRQPEPPGVISRAALGVLARTVDLMWRESDARRRNATWLAERVGKGGRIPGAGVGRPGYLRFPVVLPSGHRRLDESWGRSLGIMPGYPRPLNSLPGPTASAREFPGSLELVSSIITLPVHSQLSERDLNGLVEWLQLL
jgi:hypothetical protein